MIRDEWRTWLENGPALYIASAARDGTIDCIRASGLRIVSPERVRLTVNRTAGGRLVENIGGGSWISVSATQIIDYTCLQFKGVPTLVEPEALDVESCRSYAEKFRANCARLWAGLPARGYLRLRMKPELCVELSVREIYDQTPGRGAGRAVATP